jgi:hypothetical protein
MQRFTSSILAPGEILNFSRTDINGIFHFVQEFLSMHKRMSAGIALLSLSVLTLTTSPATAQIITNGGFETGDFTGWTQTGNFGFTFVDGDPNTDLHAAWLGAFGTQGYLEQDIVTTPGQYYQLGFFLNNFGQPNSFEAAIDNLTTFSVVDMPDQPYAPYTIGFTATNASTNIKFGFYNNTDYFHLDDVSVTAVPEPGVLAFGALVGVSLLGLILRRRRL